MYYMSGDFGGPDIALVPAVFDGTDDIPLEFIFPPASPEWRTAEAQIGKFIPVFTSIP